MNRHPTVRAIVVDIDGTLTERGNLESPLPELQDAVRAARQSGILFNLASARPYVEQEEFFHRLIGSSEFLSGEGILYEASSIRLFGDSTSYRLGGLSIAQLQEIRKFVAEHGLCLDMVPQAHNEKYETTTGYVTKTFITEGRTDTALLERRFQEAKPIIERHFHGVEAVMSADAIDINAKGVTKAKPTVKYAELVGIPLEHLAAIGDSGNDLPMLDVVGNAGGLAVYVGKRKEQAQRVQQYRRHLIPQQKGPWGTIEALTSIRCMNTYPTI